MGELTAENVKVSVPDGVGVLVFVAGVEEVQEGGEVMEIGEGGGGDVELFLREGGVRGWGVVVHLDDWFFGIWLFFRYMLCVELRRGFFLLFVLVFFCAGACGVRAGPGRHGSCGQNIFMEYSPSL